MATPLPATLGALRASEFTPARLARSVKDELRENLIAKLRDSAKTSARSKENSATLFPGIVGYEDTVIPQLVNAVLSPPCPDVAGSEVRDNPYAPISKFSRDLIAKMGDQTPIAWLTPDDRYV